MFIIFPAVHLQTAPFVGVADRQLRGNTLRLLLLTRTPIIISLLPLRKQIAVSVYALGYSERESHWLECGSCDISVYIRRAVAPTPPLVQQL